MKRKRDKRAYARALHNGRNRKNFEMVEYRSPFFDRDEKPRSPTKLFVNDDLKEIKPKTENQMRIFESFEDGKHLLIHGAAGTGKTFLACFLALNAVLDPLNGEYDSIVLIRSAVPTRDMGYMPGKESEKVASYERPYESIFAELFVGSRVYEVCRRNGSSSPYQTLKGDGVVEFTTTSFIRGLTFNNKIVILDEAENLNYHELDSIITRVGEGCRLIICGDTAQTDLITKSSDRTGLPQLMRVIERMPNYFDMIEMQVEDIVRSGLVRDYLIAKRDLENADNKRSETLKPSIIQPFQPHWGGTKTVFLTDEHQEIVSETVVLETELDDVYIPANT